jgi:MbtH protein
MTAQERSWRVVVNAEEQYSVWPAERDIPGGWSAAGFEGSEEACLDHIQAVWSDIRPKSLRDHLAALKSKT